MNVQYHNSELRAKPEPRPGIRIANQVGAIVPDMGRRKNSAPHPVSVFVRHLIEESAHGTTDKELARAMGVAPSMVAQIKSGQSQVTLVTLPGVSRALGFATEMALFVAAYAYAKGAAREKSDPELARQAEAAELALTYGITEEQIGRVMARFPIGEFGHNDQLWWLSQFHAERTADQQRKGYHRAVASRRDQADVASKKTLALPAAPKKPAKSRRAG